MDAECGCDRSTRHEGRDSLCRDVQRYFEHHEATPYIVRVGFTVWQQSYHIGKWAAMNGITRASSIVSDYAAGLDAEEAFKTGFTDGGGKLVSSIRAPLRSPDYVPFLERIRREKPQALYGFNPGGPEATRFIKAFHDLGLAEAGIRLIGPAAIVPDDELPNMGEPAVGVISSSHYSSAGDRPANKAFVAEWQKAYGADSVPSYFAAGGGTAWRPSWTSSTAERRHRAETHDGDAQPLEQSGESAWPMQIDPETRDVIQNIYIGAWRKLATGCRTSSSRPSPR
jgi:branched-chain amino acid transport system substrate-binding protein